METSPDDMELHEAKAGSLRDMEPISRSFEQIISALHKPQKIRGDNG